MILTYLRIKPIYESELPFIEVVRIVLVVFSCTSSWKNKLSFSCKKICPQYNFFKVTLGICILAFSKKHSKDREIIYFLGWGEAKNEI